MKKIFEFAVPKKMTVKETDSKENEKGETVTIETEVEKEVDQKIFLKKPTRSLYDEAELYYGVKLSEGIKAGLLTRALLARRFSDDGGTMSDDDKTEYAEMYMRLFDIQNDLDRIGLIADSQRTEEEKQKTSTLVGELAVLKDQIRGFEMNQAALFEQTAENRARNKTVLWWALNLAHKEMGDGKHEPIFPGANIEEKLDVYDSLEESGDIYYEVLLKQVLYYTSFWYVGRASTQEEFEDLLIELGNIEDSEDVMTEEVETEVEAQPEPVVEAQPEPVVEAQPEPVVEAVEEPPSEEEIGVN